MVQAICHRLHVHGISSISDFFCRKIPTTSFCLGAGLNRHENFHSFILKINVITIVIESAKLNKICYKLKGL